MESSYKDSIAWDFCDDFASVQPSQPVWLETKDDDFLPFRPMEETPSPVVYPLEYSPSPPSMPLSFHPEETLRFQTDTPVYFTLQNKSLLGSVLVTTYRFCFRPRLTFSRSSYFEFPLAFIAHFEVTSNSNVLVISCKDNRPTLCLRGQQMGLLSSQLMMVRLPHTLNFTSSFDMPLLPLSTSDGRFRVSHLNQNFNLIPTYPEHIFTLSKFTDKHLLQVTQFRLEKRIPALSFAQPEWGDGAQLWRSSQPQVRFFTRSCRVDEFMLTTMACMSRNQKLLVLDCRSKVAVLGNTLSSNGGTEPYWNYPQNTTVFADLGNIHDIRKSFENLTRNNEDGSEEWLLRVGKLLVWSRFVGHQVRTGHAVLVHCTHGWDRTPQITSLTQLFLSPYTRTVRGFCQLVQKEFISFGHQFELRNSNSVWEQSPIFLQFLDCVYQLKHLFPTQFEFNNTFLLCLAHHSMSHRFKEFSCNSELKIKTEARHKPSLWEMIWNMESEFVDLNFVREGQREFLPSVSVLTSRLYLWEFWIRHRSSCLAENQDDITWGVPQHQWESWM